MRRTIPALVALALVSFGARLASAESASGGRWPAKASSTPIITKVSDSTKRLFGAKKKSVTSGSGGTSVVQPKTTRSEKPGFFKSLFQPEPPPPPKTIKEWMSLKKVQP